MKPGLNFRLATTRSSLTRWLYDPTWSLNVLKLKYIGRSS